ncbi:MULTISPECIES: hypothetical protein [unclassified Bradyrhizobium]|uniref:hypothetical protein n=1 Tax=unclassified Bradyrhizobium TaxID=2631580 RepID=UPI0028ED8469|nr:MULTISPECIES: hypothetical protein [unclassified Bradyrhizobium]
MVAIASAPWGRACEAHQGILSRGLCGRSVDDEGQPRKVGAISAATVTQFHWRGPGVLVDYAAVRAVMKEVKLRYPEHRIGYPKIGAGLAKGD